MCRNIKVLYNFDPPAGEDLIHAAVEQYVRKVSRFAKPSSANEKAFNQAVSDITKTTTILLASLVTTAPPRSRGQKEARAHARALNRFGRWP
jgi:hypothetical protein